MRQQRSDRTDIELETSRYKSTANMLLLFYLAQGICLENLAFALTIENNSLRTQGLLCPNGILLRPNTFLALIEQDSK